LSTWLYYYSIKLIKVQNPTLAIIYYLIVLGLLSYVIIYTVIVAKGYQEYDILVGSTMLKVKGSAHTGPLANPVVYDEYDLVQPPLQPNALFITTSFQNTQSQTRGTCEGNLPDGNDGTWATGEVCNCSFFKGDVTLCCYNVQQTENGMKTGVCGPNGYCLLDAWCPLENQTYTPPSTDLLDVQNWTIFSRVDIRFPNFGISKSNTKNVLIPNQNLFAIGDICIAAGTTFAAVKARGAIILGSFVYNCDLNKNVDDCNPAITWIRIDPTEPDALSKGFNYRYTTMFRDPTTQIAYRDLWKAYGVSIVYQVYGKGGKFSIVSLTMTLGSGLALLGVATAICDIIMQYILPNHESYYQEKYQEVNLPDRSDELTISFRTNT